ncbi:MAG: bifunctional phosphopantothenoylcysteine decarboxylase/phosphopantothenate--cysteine ligase CoaBC [Firmicutes bacterium]|nr:bifunctional phosphopantothenoylcysteine decarboxylase/phosphopantothenate--cysteine ligase CoaBC [Bacillota bacterium]
MRIVVGVAGGIAAYKACEVVSRLVKAGHEVRVTMTPAAAQFVAPLTFRALSGHDVGMQSGDEPEGPISHVTLSHWAEAMVIAPATAALMARLATGNPSEMVSLVYLGFRGPVVLAPAMEPEMWEHPRTQANLRTLQQDGVHIVGPVYGRMASGLEGWGRMAEPSDVVDALDDVTAPKDLTGLRLVITAGATWEYFDPVRLLTNPSTGLMGVMLANQAARRGASVTLVAGPTATHPLHPAVEKRSVVSAREMLDAVSAAMPQANVLIGAAAVSDFRPAERLDQKAHKEAVGLSWNMERNPDVIRIMAEQYRGQKLLIGFAAETENALEQAAKKRAAKGLDAVVANFVGDGQGFGEGLHQAWLVTESGVQALEGSSKTLTATQILDWIRNQTKGA